MLEDRNGSLVKNFGIVVGDSVVGMPKRQAFGNPLGQDFELGVRPRKSLCTIKIVICC